MVTRLKARKTKAVTLERKVRTCLLCPHPFLLSVWRANQRPIVVLSLQNRAARRVAAFRKAEKHISEYRRAEKAKVNARRAAKNEGQLFREEEPKVLFVVRIRGSVCS